MRLPKNTIAGIASSRSLSSIKGLLAMTSSYAQSSIWYSIALLVNFAFMHQHIV